MSLDERSFFTDKPEQRSARYTCPRCHRTHDYSLRWVRRVKKERLPAGADERDRAKFAKLRDHLIRVDDEVVCKTCAKKFEVPSLHSLMFVDQLEGLPKDEEEDGAGESAAVTGESAAVEGGPDLSSAKTKPLPARFSRPSKGWKG